LESNPILSQDSARAENQINTFVDGVIAKNKLSERDGKFILIDQDGNDLLDSHGHRVAFDDSIKTEATSLFDFMASKPKSPPAAQGQNQNSPKNTVIINSHEEYSKKMSEAKDNEEKFAVNDAYMTFIASQK
jgi:hypothetical protein